MITTITKSDFERALPVGTSSHENIFEMVLPEIEARLSFLNDRMLGNEGIKIVDDAGKDGMIQRNFIRLAVVSAFLSVMRQLDLVLTPTGFGVVSNDNITPASKQRVDALEEQLRRTELTSKALVLNALRSPEWGITIQAKTNIPTLYDEYEFFVIRNVEDVKADEWVKLQQPIREADTLLRKKISDGQMDVFMEDYRTNNVERMGEHSEAIIAIRDFFSVWCLTGRYEAMEFPLRKLLAAMEKPSAAEYYKEYLSSEAYTVNHHETFQNSKDSTAFIFNG